MSVGFLFDPNRCTGCAACSLACTTENGLDWGTSWRQIVPFNPERRPGVPSFHLSLACNHCAEAPCVAHCPTGAMRRDPATGAVVVDEARCIGCRYCAWVCPYDAPRFDERRGVMAKCTLCDHRLRAGSVPACVEACPTSALGYGPPSGEERIPGCPAAAARPRIRFAPLRRDAAPPESTWSLPPEVLAAFGPRADADAAPGPITFRSELPLWLFTSGAAALVGWVLAAVLGGPALGPLGFAAAAAVTLAVSSLHLGRKGRAWRALANVRTSHLSREIAGYGLFLGATSLWLASGATPAGEATAGPDRSAAVVAAALGVLALFLVDRVYDPVRARSGRPLHSADTLLTGPLWAAALLQATFPYAALALLKTALYARRHRARAALRLAVLALPPALWLTAPPRWGAVSLLLVAAGELFDRAEIYREIGPPSPRRQARSEVAAWKG